MTTPLIAPPPAELRLRVPADLEIDPAVVRRFASYVEVVGECWHWRGSTQRGGYPVFWLFGQPMQAGRIAWEMDGHGSTAGLTLRRDHDRCPSGTSCIRPEHHAARPNASGRTTSGVFRTRAGEAEASIALVREDAAPPVPAAVATLPAPPELEVPAGDVAVVGPFASGSVLVFTPWGNFTGDSMLEACAIAERAGKGRP